NRALGGRKINISEINNKEEESEDQNEQTLQQKLNSKIIKTKMSAFETLSKQFQSTKALSFFDEFSQDWDKKLSESNPGVQEQVCIALKNYLIYHPLGKSLKITDISIFRALIEKCISSPKPQIQQISRELLILIFEKSSEVLKKLQLDELQKYYIELEKVPMIPLRASEEEKNKINNNNKNNNIQDIYEIADGVDIFIKFNEKWCDKILELQKWQEKKEMLDDIIQAASVPKVISNINNFYPIIQVIKRLLNDNNANVQQASIKLSGVLCKSIRKNFNMASKQLFESVLQKLRDKKTSIIEETKISIDNFWFSITLEEVLDEIKEALQDKTPTLKLQTMYILEKYFDIKGDKKTIQIFKQNCLFCFKKLFDDSVAEVREYAFKTIGKFYKIKDFFTIDELQKNSNDHPADISKDCERLMLKLTDQNWIIIETIFKQFNVNKNQNCYK
ncbi:hypothetical protein IMG5_062950, partial [Ichthyophthirius multifiliis]